MQIIIICIVFWLPSSLRFKDFHRITREIPYWIWRYLIKIFCIQYFFLTFNNPFDDAIILISIKHIIQVFFVIIYALWLRLVVILLYYTRCASDYLINRVIIDWVNSTLNLGWIYRQFCCTTLILNFLKIIILIGRWLHPGVISLNNVFEALICQINPDGGWKLNVCEDLLRMKSTLRLNISI